MRSTFCRIGAALPFVIAVASAHADVISLTTVRDNTLYESALGDLSNGAGAGFFAGRTNQGLIRRGLLAFDVAGSVPAGATITSVALTLNATQGAGGPRLMGLHRALADWGEAGSVAPGSGGMGAPAQPGDATWLHTFYDDEYWTTPGGDFAAAPSQSTIVDTVGFFTWSSSAGLVADVQSWLDDPGANFGWVIIGDESVIATSKRFSSREEPDAGLRPQLVIEFTPVPGPSAFALVAAAALAPRRRRR